MINNEHQWVSTDEAEYTVQVHTKETKDVEAAAIPQVKRLPAAFIGIGMIVLTGIFFVFRNDLLPGQLTSNPDDIEIALTDSGAVPADVTLRPGKTITWINSASIPHILMSETLRDNENKLLESAAIFPGSEFSFTLGSSVNTGEYEYTSQTSPLIVGKILVQAAVPTPAPLPMPTTARSESSAELPPTQIPSQVSGEIQNSPMPSQLTGSIPENPFTIGNTTSVIPGEVRQTSSNSSSGMTVTEHRPATQPETGMGIWVAAIAGLLSFLAVFKSAEQ